MSLNPKTIAISLAGLLAAAGGLYAFMPGNQTAPADGVTSVQTTATAEPQTSQVAVNQPNVAQVEPKGAIATVTEQPSTLTQPASQGPKKLTRAQLTPPPLTEEEKLQRAAEQESNF